MPSHAPTSGETSTRLGEQPVKRTIPILIIVLLTLLLAACQDPPPTFTYEGITITGGVEQPLSLTYEQRGERLTGEYQIRAAKGTFRGAIDADTITDDLTPSPDCTYTLEGTITDTTLTGSFQPTDCPGGEAGTWTLERQ